MSENGDDDTSGKEGWTIRQFTRVCGRPWFALLQHDPLGNIQRGVTGYYEDLMKSCATHGITPRHLPPITEAEYYQLCDGNFPQKPITHNEGHGRQRQFQPLVTLKWALHL